MSNGNSQRPLLLRRAHSYSAKKLDIDPPKFRAVKSDDMHMKKSVHKLIKLKYAEKFTEDDVRDVFRFFDRDGDGRISIAEIQSVFSDESTSNLVQMFDEVKTPTEGLKPRSSPKSPEPFNLPKIAISPLSTTSEHSSKDMELSFEEFYEMVLSTPSDNWCRLISKQLKTALGFAGDSNDCLRDEWSKFHLERLDERVGKRLKLDMETLEWIESSVRVKLDTSKPFASGTMRQCYRFKKMSSHHKNLNVKLRKRHTLWKNQHNYIAKEYIQKDRNTLDTIKSDVTMQMISKYYAEIFNTHRPKKYVDFLEAWILILQEKNGHEQIFFAEAFVPGSFKKYSDNLGFVGTVSLSSFGGRILQEDVINNRKNKNRENFSQEISQAYSHFTFEASDRKLVIVDIQGIGELYTDPQIHTVVDDDRNFIGHLKAGQTQRCGNLGHAGVGAFIRSHKCGPMCKNLLKLCEFQCVKVSPTFDLMREARFVCLHSNRELEKNDEHVYVLESFCYEIQESIRSCSSVCDDSVFQYNLLKQASFSNRWRVVLAILLMHKNIMSNLLDLGTSALVPIPPQSKDIDSMTRFYVWWTSIPTTQKLQHALRSRGFKDSLFWTHVFHVSKVSTDLRWTEDNLLRDAKQWSKNVYYSDSMTKGRGIFIAAGAALVSITLFVWLRVDSHRLKK